MMMIRKNLKLFLFFAALLITSVAFGQKIKITGKVTDQNKEGIPGASVVVVGTTTGTITDLDGKYSLEVTPQSTLSFSFVGYKVVQIPVQNQTVINVQLEQENVGVEEVVVIGYGTTKKQDATGSVTAVSSSNFNKGSIVSPEQLVMGKIAGVNITTGGGAPGTGSTIRIRGGSSLSASNDPLFVIDGVPVDNDGISGMRNPLSTINPGDIETFTVLKDASATAIFGSRASNGVILITTKKGKAGAMKVTYDGKVSIGTSTGKIDVLTPSQFQTLVIQQFPGDIGVIGLLGKAHTDWQDVIFNTSVSNDHNVSLAGSAGKIPFRLSMGYTRENGLLLTSNLDRYTGSLGLSPTFFNNHLKVNANIKGMYIKNRFADEGSISNAVGFDPTQEVYDSSSKYGGYFTWLLSDGNPNTNAPANPLAMLNMREDNSKVWRSLGNIQLDYSFPFLPELRANLNLGYDYSGTNGSVIIPENYSANYDATFGGGLNQTYTQSKKDQLLDFYLNYTKQLDQIKSKIEMMAGYSWQHFYRDDYVYGTNTKGTKILTPKNWNPTEYYLVSFFGRLNYSILERYLLTFTLRDDGTSRFSKNNRWGLFPSAAFAWQIKNEPFLKNVNAVSALKLRLGYGVTGQQNIGLGDYPYLARFTKSFDNARYLFGTDWMTTLRPEGYDSNIKWEQTTTYNVGFDFGFLDNRLTGSIDAYYRKTTNLLNVVPVAAGTNFTNQILTNVGDLENQGIELSLNDKIISKKDLLWEVGLNVSYNKNKITRLTASQDPTYTGVETGGIAGGVGNNIQIHTVGYPTSSFFVYEQVYDENHKPVEGLYVDRNGDGQITTLDKYHFKKPAPDVFLGFSSGLNYKNWDFSLAGRVNLGNYVYNNIDSRNSVGKEIYWSSGYLRNVTTDFYNTHFKKDEYWSDYYIQNASFLRMDNITAGYTFKKVWDSKSNIRLYSTVQNVFVITKYKGLDPEVSGGIDNQVYPRPRVYMLGVNVDF